MTISFIDYDFDPQGYLKKQVVMSNDKNFALVTLSSDSFKYNSIGLVTRSTNGVGLVTETTYNSAGQIRMQEVGVGAQYPSHFTNQNEGIDQTTIYDYYANGTLSSVTLPSEDVVGYLYDPVNHTSWERTNHVAGNTTALGGTVAFLADNFLVAETITDKLGRTVSSNNRLTGARTDLHYDDLRNDLPTRTNSKFVVDKSGANQCHCARSQYDADGQILWQKTGPTAEQVFIYDSLGNVVKQATKAELGADYKARS